MANKANKDKQRTKQANKLAQTDAEFDFPRSVHVLVGGRLEHGAGLCSIAAVQGNGNSSECMDLQLFGLCQRQLAS